MKGIRARTRFEWVKAVLGQNSRFTLNQFVRVRRRLAERGWFMAQPSEGSSFERVVAVHQKCPVYKIIEAYQSGKRWYSIVELTGLLAASITESAGAERLAKAGLAIVRADNGQIELDAVDPRVARLVNQSRIGPQIKGFSARRVIEACLQTKHPSRKRINITDERRLYAAECLESHWQIDCDDLLAGRLRVRLVSRWTFKDHSPPLLKMLGS